MHADRPILILTCSTGAGHNIAAGALAAAVRARVPAETVEVHDVLACAGPLLRRLYGGGYTAIVRHLPVAMGWLYDRMDVPAGRGADRVRAAFQRWLTRRASRFIESRRPKLVINTHYLPAEIVAEARRAGRLDCPQVIVTTDFETHRIWVQTPAERWYAASELGRAYLVACGAPPHGTLVTGIPVRPAFEALPARPQARERLGLEIGPPLVLLSGGAMGLETTARLFSELLRMPAAGQVAVIAGRNERLRVRLAEHARAAARPVRVVGYTDEMHLWMAAADLLVTKPGGLTCAEALTCGLPMLLVDPIPGQETRNADYLLEHGAGVKVNHPRLLGHRVAELLADPARLDRMRAAAGALARPGAAAQIAADALAVLSTPGASGPVDPRRVVRSPVGPYPT